MKKEIKVWAITLIAFWWLAPNKTNAQQQDSLQSKVLSEIVTTATKFPKSQGETGKVLTIIDEEQIQQSAGKSVAQLLNEQVGVIVSGANSNPGKDKSVYLRGASNGYTLILLDGIPVNDVSGGGGAFDLRMLPIDQIERIEILKGSQSTLYGSDAIAGVINIITKKSGNKPFGLTGTASYGTYNTRKLNVGVAGTTKYLDYNAGYTNLKSDGISEAKDKTGGNNYDKDGFDQNAFQLNLGVRPVKNLVIRPFLRYSNVNGKFDAGAFADDVVPRYESKLFNTGLNGEYTYSKGVVHLQYARDNVQRTYFTRDYYNQDSTVRSNYDGYFDNAEIYSNYDLSEHFQLLGGINYQKHHMNTVNVDSTLHILNTYASFFVKNLNGLYAEIGGRYVHHSVFGDTFIYSINPSYILNKQLKLFINYSTGFKAPMLDQLYNPYYGVSELKPEKSRNSEVGIQFVSLNNLIDIRATVFNRSIRNVITYDLKTYKYINYDRQNDMGFELESNFNISRKFKLKTFYAFINGKVTTKNDAEVDTTYNNLIRRPKHSIGLNASYTITNNFLVSGNIKTFSKRTDIFFDDNFARQIVTMGSYVLLDIYAEYKFLKQKLTLFVDAKNLLNQKYYEVYGYSTMGTNVNVGVNFKF